MVANPKNLQQHNTLKIGEILVQGGLISEEDLNQALEESSRTGDYLGQILIKQAKITREQLGMALSQQHNVKYLNLSKVTIDVTLLELLPEEFIRDKQVVPVTKEGGRLVVAMVNPSDRPAIDEITFLTGMRPSVTVTTYSEFQEIFTKHVGERSSNSLMDEISSMSASHHTEEHEVDFRQQRDAEISETSNPLVKLVNAIIEEGIERNASDIHIEPRYKKFLVRFRIDGILRTILDIPVNMEASFVSRIKVMSRMDIAEHRRPQDGRISTKYKGTEYNLRVNTLPVGDGREKLVIRILRPSKNIATFQDLGFSEDEISKLELLYKSPYGIVLVCGPTGSGKTTTLYTILNMINDEVRNISTIEDPVELTIEGLNQSQVNHKAEFTFASSMRALLRQDPDVIMVGEIRDVETLEAGIHAALTGHLVFSTIHSNTTSATVTRMIEMGAAPNLVSSALVGVIA
ncbi:MAG: Flp pilus assembly complex ATPase component TadA, partial [Cyanobacteria bacterium]|nr:Flp pilus assembly complex ATPase component TadA [Cyanobacteriota bacterium]